MLLKIDFLFLRFCQNHAQDVRPTVNQKSNEQIQEFYE